MIMIDGWNGEGFYDAGEELIELLPRYVARWYSHQDQWTICGARKYIGSGRFVKRYILINDTDIHIDIDRMLSPHELIRNLIEYTQTGTLNKAFYGKEKKTDED